jgi:predicted DNA-binding transcriptional regulator AlpA
MHGTLEIQSDTKMTFREWCEYVGVGGVGGEQDRVLSIPEWAKLAGFSEKTGREVIDAGTGPRTVQLSPNRIGVRVCDHRAWLEARTRQIAA